MGRVKRKVTDSTDGIHKKRKTPAASPEPVNPEAAANEPKMPYHEKFHMYRLMGLKNTIGMPELDDVTFTVGKKKKEYNANRLPLVSISKKLGEIIANQPGTKGDPIELDEGVATKGFAAILKFAYGHDPEVTPENVVHVSHAAQVLEVTVLEEKCMEYVKTVLAQDEKYLMKYLEKATEFQNHAIIKLCFTSLQERGGIPQFLASPAFCALPSELVNMILKLDALPVEETVVWETCIKWAGYQAIQQKTNLNEELKKVYHNVRFPLCEPGFFSSKVVPTGILTQEEMLKLFTFLTYKAGNAPTDPFLKAPRILWDETEVCRFPKAAGGEWFHLDDSLDCICFTVDKPCELLGIGCYVGEGTTKTLLKLHEGNNDDSRTQVAKVKKTIKANEKSATPYKLEFGTPVNLKPRQIYEIELDSVGPVSLRGNQGNKDITHELNGLAITFTFSKLKSQSSETNTKKGNLPSLYVRVFSGKSA